MEKLAEALYALDPDTQPWDGDPVGFDTSLKRGGNSAERAVQQARMLISLGVVQEDQLDSLPGMWELRTTFHRNKQA